MLEVEREGGFNHRERIEHKKVFLRHQLAQIFPPVFPFSYRCLGAFSRQDAKAISIQNPKSEALNPKQAQIPNIEIQNLKTPRFEPYVF